MIEPRIEQLLNAELDEPLSDAEQSELEGALEQSVAARVQREQLQRLDQTLRDLTPLAPPPWLKEQIRQRSNSSTANTRWGSGRRGWLGRWPRFSVGLGYGLTAAAALLLAFVLVQFRPEPSTFDQMVGTAVPAPDANAMNRVVSRHEFALEGISGSSRLERRERAIVADFEFRSAQPLELRIGLADSGLKFKGMAQFEDELELIEVSDDTIQVRGHGRRKFAVLLERHAAKAQEGMITLEFSSNGNVVQQAMLDPRIEE